MNNLLYLLPFTILLVNKSTPQDGELVSWRPKPIIFAVVWSMLVLMMSLSWYLSLNDGSNKLINILFILVILGCILWQYEYHREKSRGVTVFIFILFSLVSLLVYLLGIGKLYSGILLIPLTIWIVIAMVMNIIEVDKMNL